MKNAFFVLLILSLLFVFTQSSQAQAQKQDAEYSSETISKSVPEGGGEFSKYGPEKLVPADSLEANAWKIVIEAYKKGAMPTDSAETKIIKPKINESRKTGDVEKESEKKNKGEFSKEDKKHDKRPPGWDKGKKTGWGDGDIPPGQRGKRK